MERTAGFPESIRQRLGKLAAYRCQKCDRYDPYAYGAHIISKSKKGPRSYLLKEEYKDLDAKSLKSILDKAENGLWLCGSCHQEVDHPGNASKFPIATLMDMKNRKSGVTLSLDPRIYTIRREEYVHTFHLLTGILDSGDHVTPDKIGNKIFRLLNDDTMHPIEVEEYISLLLENHVLPALDRIEFSVIKDLLTEVCEWIGRQDEFNASMNDIIYHLAYILQLCLWRFLGDKDMTNDTILSGLRIYTYILALVESESIQSITEIIREFRVPEMALPYIECYIRLGMHFRTRYDPSEVEKEAVGFGLDPNYVLVGCFRTFRNDRS